MTKTMKAVIKPEQAPGMRLAEVPVPQIGPQDALIKVRATSICGTDLHIYKWDEWSQRTIKPGLVIGHEFVGRIVDIGPGVRGYTVGQRVSAEGHIVCGVCRNCRAGKQHQALVQAAMRMGSDLPGVALAARADLAVFPMAAGCMVVAWPSPVP